MRANPRQTDEKRQGPLIEGELVVRPPTWRRRAARWVYAGSRRAAQTYGLKGLVLRLLAVASLLAIASAAALYAALLIAR